MENLRDELERLIKLTFAKREQEQRALIEYIEQMIAEIEAAQAERQRKLKERELLMSHIFGDRVADLMAMNSTLKEINTDISDLKNLPEFQVKLRELQAARERVNNRA
jgi:hypothetical protein